jgi:hypothetical protein
LHDRQEEVLALALQGVAAGFELLLGRDRHPSVLDTHVVEETTGVDALGIDGLCDVVTDLQLAS